MGHLFPATHLGVHRAIGITSTPLYALYPCADVRMHFGHVSALDPSILSEVGAFGPSDCAVPYEVGGVTLEPCTKNVSINVAAGARLGTQQGTMDWGATDRRQSLAYVNPRSFGEAADNPFGQDHAVCPENEWRVRPEKPPPGGHGCTRSLAASGMAHGGGTAGWGAALGRDT